MDKYEILIVGSGIGGFEAAFAFQSLAPEQAHVTVLSPEESFMYRPAVLDQLFGGAPGQDIPLNQLTERAGASHKHGNLASVSQDHSYVTTDSGEQIYYDFLLIAVGCRRVPSIEGATTIGIPGDIAAFGEVLSAIDRHQAPQITFVVPGGPVWPLPIYEIALRTAHRVRFHSTGDATINLVTSEDEPMGLFGLRVAKTVRTRLADAGISLTTGTLVSRADDTELHLVPSGSIATSHTVTLGLTEGPEIPGLPCNPEGYLQTDPFGRVYGTENVYAAGDVTAFPIKQGGLAAQQANVAARSIAAAAGAPVKPTAFEAVLKGRILSGRSHLYMDAPIIGGKGDSTVIASQPLWQPATRIAAEFLTPVLCEIAPQIALGDSAPDQEDGIEVSLRFPTPRDRIDMDRERTDLGPDPEPVTTDRMTRILNRVHSQPRRSSDPK